jgi:peroxiredoxin Q/BCP
MSPKLAHNMHHLKPGDPAPAFSATDQSGNTHTLNAYAGQRLVIYFYPRDNTPTCTVQACNLRNGTAPLKEAGIAVLGVSSDSARKHANFIRKFSLNFDLLVDEDHAVHEAFGVWGEKKFMGRTYNGTHRTTFLIEADGTIAHIFRKPKAKRHTEEILEAFGV